MRGCVKYIHDPDTTLTFDLKVNQGQIYGVYDMALFSGLSFFVLAILSLALQCITTIRCVAYIHELCMTLTFHLNINIIFSP